MPASLSQKEVSQRQERRSARLQEFSSPHPPTLFLSTKQFSSRWLRIAVLRATFTGSRTAHERDRRGFLSSSEYLSTFLRLSRQMTSQNGPNTRISVPREGFATTKPPHNTASDARYVIPGNRIPSHRRHGILVPDQAMTSPREEPPEATPTSRPRPFTHRIETRHTQQQQREQEPQGGGSLLTKIWKTEN